MTLTTPDTPTAGTSSPDTPAAERVQARDDLAPAAERGRLVVDDVVVQKIAAVAAARSPDVQRRWSLRGSNERGVQVFATVSGTTARVRVVVAVGYPCDIHTVAAGIRDRVTTAVTDSTGLIVRRVEVNVVDFVRAGS